MRETEYRDSRTHRGLFRCRSQSDPDFKNLSFRHESQSDAAQPGAVPELKISSVNHGRDADRKRPRDGFEPVLDVADHHIRDLGHHVENLLVNGWAARVQIRPEHARANDARKHGSAAEYARTSPIAGNSHQRDEPQFRSFGVARNPGILNLHPQHRRKYFRRRFNYALQQDILIYHEFSFQGDGQDNRRISQPLRFSIGIRRARV